MTKERIIQEMDGLGRRLYEKFGTESYVERCVLQDLKDKVKSLEVVFDNRCENYNPELIRILKANFKGGDGFIPTKELFKEFECILCGMNDVHFGRHLRRLGFKKKRVRVKGVLNWGYEIVRF